MTKIHRAVGYSNVKNVAYVVIFTSSGLLMNDQFSDLIGNFADINA